jgi:peroxiredoxin
MPIQPGDRFPEATFTQMTERRAEARLQRRALRREEGRALRRAGAFTPDLLEEAPAGIREGSDALKAKGVDLIACMSVNDAFVMDAWGAASGASGKVLMLADGNGDVTRQIGLESDFSKHGMGQRARRFSMILQDGVVKELNVEGAGRVQGLERRGHGLPALAAARRREHA